jgi:hypothetical protein
MNPSSVWPRCQAFAGQIALSARRPVQTILDVGAQVGGTVALYPELFPQAIVHGLVPIYEGQAFVSDVYGSLARFGYTLFDIDRERSENSHVKWAYASTTAPARP